MGFYEHIFSQEKEKEWASHRVFTSFLYNEEYELYFPSKKIFFNTSRIKKIKRNLFCNLQFKYKSN